MLKICQSASKDVLTTRWVSGAANPIDSARSVQRVLVFKSHTRVIFQMLLLAHLVYQVHNADSLECQHPSSEFDRTIRDRLRLYGSHYDNVNLSVEKRLWNI